MYDSSDSNTLSVKLIIIFDVAHYLLKILKNLLLVHMIYRFNINCFKETKDKEIARYRQYRL